MLWRQEKRNLFYACTEDFTIDLKRGTTKHHSVYLLHFDEWCQIHVHCWLQLSVFAYLPLNFAGIWLLHLRQTLSSCMRESVIARMLDWEKRSENSRFTSAPNRFIKYCHIGMVNKVPSNLNYFAKCVWWLSFPMSAHFIPWLLNQNGILCP